MSTTRTQFDRNFKLKAVELSYQRSNIRSLADELGIRVALLYRRRREFASHAGASFAGNGIDLVALKKKEPDRVLYLAVPENFYQNFFDDPFL